MDFKAETLARIAKPFNYEWTAHGLGMLKTYLDPDTRQFRLNVWHRRLIVKGTSPRHTHPWGLRSFCIAGQITNTRADRVEEGGIPYMEGRINCAKFCGIEGEPTRVLLLERPLEIYTPGMGYSQEPDEIHHTAFMDGSVTILERLPCLTCDGMASVFWPEGEEYGDASRKATRQDIVETISAARAQLGVGNAA